MSHARDSSGAPGIASARLRWAPDGLVIGVSVLVTVLAYLTPASGVGIALRVAASALTVGLVVRAVLRSRRAPAAGPSSPWDSEELFDEFINRHPVIGYIVPCDTENERVFEPARRGALRVAG